jgi:hypothetical protein
VEGEVEWDCLAEGKQGRGLPGKERSQKEDKKPIVEAAKETVTNNGKTLESSAVVVSKGRPTIVEDADEFDDDELDELLSG